VKNVTCSCSKHSEVLVQSEASWNGKRYESYPTGVPQLTVVRMTIPARSSLPWHTHAMPNAAYILSGQLTLEERATGRTHTFVAGEAFPESVNDTHRGTTGDEDTVVIVTYATVAGLPLSEEASSSN
jgi:quercetin dioxygenase-like cupin family protein